MLAVVAFGSTYYFYSEYLSLKASSDEVTQEENRKTVATVSKLIVLPEGENPTVATVVDPELLKNQPFFARAKKGDRVLIYTNARKAILYDPKNNKIIEVAPINIGEPSTQTLEPIPN